MFKFIPKEEKFFEMFVAMAQNVNEGSRLLAEMMEAGANLPNLAESIKSLEHRGDRMTHDVITKLNRTFVVPIDREDIYRLSSCIDDIMDLIESVARRIVLFKVGKLDEPSMQLSQLLHQHLQVVAAVSELKNGLKVVEHCIEINRLEDEADHVYHQALGTLFETEKDAIALIKWKEIYETLETSVDKCEDVANVIESIVVKNA
jgi:predicted phosphate transport protein (TIGR00153 family)